MSGQAGVKTLLDAEQKAQEIVNKARRGTTFNIYNLKLNISI